ncbi:MULTISPECIES: amino acid permease [Caproicibacterium]|uniref:Amino acid permease n=1 Tax=Caproicibacterium argilliputei TaxID=3030016 RepID=A0AA97DA91_9FIRM|nr:amino acid permease [Caproicibacterium argilliputei]WOC33124.1 amino acid permease [Caproicibacterium argilliputei]
MQSIQNSSYQNTASSRRLNAFTLAGLGIGSIIGSGFFLGCALPIQQAGPSVVLTFLICGFLFSQVLAAMTGISMNRPITGSFKVYAEQFLGKYIGFVTGWVIFFANVLAIASEAVAAAIFLQYWLPQVPLAPLACLILLLVIGINSLNTEKFGLVESVMAVIKIAVLLLFLVICFRFLTARGITARPSPFQSVKTFFPHGISGLLQSMLVVVFTFAGVSTVAMATANVQNPAKDVPKASIAMTGGTVTLYTLTILCIICILDWHTIQTDRSPLVLVLQKIGISWAPAAMNAVVLIAALSVMVGNYFGSVQVLASLAEAGEAPASLSKTTASGFYRHAWLTTGLLIFAVVALSFFVSAKLFNYLISASSYFTFFNWSINLVIFLLWQKEKRPEESLSSPLSLGRPGAWVTLLLLAILAVFSLLVPDFRVGFYAAALLFLLISAAYLVRGHRRKN